MRVFIPVLIAFSLSQGACAKDFIGSNGPTFEVNVQGERGPSYGMGLIVPKDWESRKSKTFDLPSTRDELPKKFSWQDKLTPIKNQGSCGSCWAFSAQATVADVLALHGKGNVDLSEQWLVSCESQSSGCNGGWYHSAFQLIAKQGDVLERDMPYLGRDTRCPASVPHIYKIAKWQELSTGVADTETLKRAIYTYGPVAVAVSVTGNFSRYRSGIYNEGTSGGINHAVNLVGWDDTANPPHWIMRNSWGTGWGENGFMRIAYGSRKIGYAAAFVDIFGPVPHGEPGPSPDPGPKPCPPCDPCTFWKWIKSWF